MMPPEYVYYRGMKVNYPCICRFPPIESSPSHLIFYF